MTPPLVARSSGANVPIELELALLALLVTDITLGQLFGWYHQIAFWDKGLHLGNSILLGFLGFVTLYVLLSTGGLRVSAPLALHRDGTMKKCSCIQAHPLRRVVLTGGPGAGKTAVLELVRQAFCRHVQVLPESAGIVFGGGFPRRRDSELARRAAQRAIFFVQRELEATVDAGVPALVLCDRGTVDGAAYWPGPGDLFSDVGTTLATELARYDAVIHLRTPPHNGGYTWTNPLRIETPEQAAEIDDRIAAIWSRHPRRFVIDATPDFLTKVGRAFELLRGELSACCRSA